MYVIMIHLFSCRYYLLGYFDTIDVLISTLTSCSFKLKLFKIWQCYMFDLYLQTK